MSDNMPVSKVGPGPQRRGEGQGASMIVGLVLIVLGAVFFLQQVSNFTMPRNWWALFILLAAVASFANVWRSYHASGTFGTQAGGSLVWSLVLTAVAGIAYFDAWDRWWPFILIAIGVGIVVANWLGTMTRKPGAES
jgi:drug/metabolite transporter (DMT)-like permease